MVLRPKDKGGLGAVDLRVQNDGLLLKQLHKFYSKKEVPWVQLIWESYYQDKVPHASRLVGSFWWKDILKLYPHYKQLAVCRVGDGVSTLFFEDQWLDQSIKDMFPRLTSFALDQLMSIKEIKDAPDLNSSSYKRFCQRLPPIFNSKIKPSRSHHFTKPSMMVYKHLQYSKNSGRANARREPSSSSGLLNIRSMLFRRNLVSQQEVNWPMCSSQAEETVSHLFFECVPREYSTFTGRLMEVQDCILQATNNSTIPFFIEICILAMWEMWKSRNRKVFDGQSASISLWILKFKEEARLQSVRVKEALRPTLLPWLQSL
ncbi:hypothetical protein U9M48_025027 [Paspalum notatum var. saurae]|uniref:Reverse transcriptase zinc-binding domain-containing protein n=1 Tax=Paspalum notatum var. saurae TaxID=547442 RepID=A0AAQ3WWQ0_PASNO